MAKFSIADSGDIMAEIDKIQSDSERIAKRAVYEAAGIVADSIRDGLHAVLASSTTSTGDLERSLGIARIERDSSGSISTAISFSGYDRRGNPNPVKARSLEYGNARGQRKRPFLKKAVQAAEGKAIDAMEHTVDAELQKITQ